MILNEDSFNNKKKIKNNEINNIHNNNQINNYNLLNDKKVGRNVRRRSTGAVAFGDPADVCTDTDDVEIPELRNDLFKHLRVLFAGGIAGSLGKTATAPLSRLTILFQVHSMVSSHHSDLYSGNVFSALKKVIKNEGILALWKGNGASVLHRFPYSAVNFLTYESVKDSLLHNKIIENENSMKIRFISGAIAGASATITCYPIDLIRTRLATQLDKKILYRGISHAFHRIRQEEGIIGLYRGLGTTLMVTVPNLSINFTIYETTKEHLLQYYNTHSHTSFFTYFIKKKIKSIHNNNHMDIHTTIDIDSIDNLYNNEKETDRKINTLTVLDSLACGATAGIASSLITFPMDVLRRRLQISGIHTNNDNNSIKNNKRIKIPHAISIAKSLYLEQGIMGFYRGLSPELLKVVPMVGITFSTFEKFKAYMEID